jgi:hypothetical protein
VHTIEPEPVEVFRELVSEANGSSHRALLRIIVENLEDKRFATRRVYAMVDIE